MCRAQEAARSGLKINQVEDLESQSITYFTDFIAFLAAARTFTHVVYNPSFAIANMANIVISLNKQSISRIQIVCFLMPAR